MNLSAIIKRFETECRTQISITGLHEAFGDCEDLKMSPDQPLHHSLYCRKRKLADSNRSCASNKKRSLEIASLGRSFCGKCPFGVKEFVQPVIFDNKLAAVCYFTIHPGTLSLKELRKKGEWLSTFIRLALAMHEKNKVSKRNQPEYYRQQCLYFLDLHYMENIAESDLADYLGLNTAYFSSLFKKVMGKTFRQALTERRIYEAKIYLKLHKDLRISYISRLCGFSDSNYFSLVFHKATGVSPKDYRKEQTASHSQE